MNDELLEYYQRELAWIRRQGEEFARVHPKIAGRLRLAEDTVEDPHVARLLEGFAFLTARVRKKLDDDYPELTDGILGTLYPHLLQPIPSMAIVQCSADPQLTGGHALARETTFETDPVLGDPVRFRTAWPLTVWPFEVSAARLSPAEGSPPEGAVAELRVTLKCVARTMTFAKLKPPAVRLFLRGQSAHALLLYELLNNNLVAVTVGAPGAARPRVLPASALRPVGLGVDESILPFSPRTPHAYRLLLEFFAFPRKFQFVELGGLESLHADVGGELQLQFWLDRMTPELTRHVDQAAVVANAVPIVNLYRHRAEPVPLDQHQPEYRVIPDARRPLSHEVWSVDRVTALGADGKQTSIPPLYDLRHVETAERGTRFFHCTRRPADASRERNDAGTEVFLSLVDLATRPMGGSNETLAIETTCTNRDLPARLPFGGDQPRLQVVGGAAPLSKIVCLTAPTPAVRPVLGNGARWRLLSHLSLDHLALTGGAAGAETLREILALYDPVAAPETRAMVQGITQVESKSAVARVQELGAVCRGVDVHVVLDPARFTGGGLYLFTCILDRFLGLSCSINSFTRLHVRLLGREGAFGRWSPRAGERTLL